MEAAIAAIPTVIGAVLPSALSALMGGNKAAQVMSGPDSFGASMIPQPSAYDRFAAGIQEQKESGGLSDLLQAGLQASQTSMAEQARANTQPQGPSIPVPQPYIPPAPQPAMAGSPLPGGALDPGVEATLAGLPPEQQQQARQYLATLPPDQQRMALSQFMGAM